MLDLKRQDVLLRVLLQARAATGLEQRLHWRLHLQAARTPFRVQLNRRARAAALARISVPSASSNCGLAAVDGDGSHGLRHPLSEAGGGQGEEAEAAG